ncbi:hypothetical protein BDY17DRAFT_34000 [Neohortaea acidophila]|uniref:DNA/RNA-binding protein Alba-like domain-containing protein n=1 Tax=Neohortaea acidophila TaxID=245834 RepID=A0A6A6PJF5_9PEZI|nr:uncharacterized protein BDY17DRAFT_34000 [Neohortaea acidophila]KAF2480198.1 hypothetical protein BDY17DRAFT_34000 [Neohortaea acidophila]
MTSTPHPTLSSNYTITHLPIAGSTQISSRVSLLVSKLDSSAAKPSNDEDATEPEKAKLALVVLTAKARYAHKLISVVEIAKREVLAAAAATATASAGEGGGGRWFQYSALSGEVVDVERRGALVGGKAELDEEDADGDEDAFEMMGAKEGGGVKKRNVPVLTVYVCGEAVRELRVAYGYVFSSLSNGTGLNGRVAD